MLSTVKEILEVFYLLCVLYLHSSMLSGKLVLAILFVVYANAQYEGDICVKDGVAGVCKNIRKCQGAINEIRKGNPPQTCSFDRSDPIVCCFDIVQPATTTTTTTTTTSRPPVATTTRRSSTTTTEYIPPEYSYVDTMNINEECEPLPLSLTSKKTGQKAWDKCVEYQEQLVYPCEKSVALTGGNSRSSHCHHNTDKLIVGGQNAAANEFPHMALLGYGQDPSIEWVCGGALISNRFILTAGHCIESRDLGNVTYAYIGALRRRDLTNGPNRYGIKNIIKHPDYRPPIKYNDIALLETDREVPLNQFTVPACLYVGDDVNDEKASATGWGHTTYSGSLSDVLQKVILTKYTHEECSSKYPAFRLMKQGVDTASQMCYGDRTMSKDTCQGDSGGPLQIKSKKINCMYVVIGVTSFGKACGYVNVPGIYTRVNNYVPWIESIVWP